MEDNQENPTDTTAASAADEKLYITNPEKWLEETVKGPDLLCIVIFRGAWCKYDRHYLRKLGHHHKTTMKNENVTLIAWTSQGAEGAKKADEEWGLTRDFGYDLVLGDETNALANYLKDDEVLGSLVIVSPEDAKVDMKLLPSGSYPNGMVMPGMVWYAHHGNIVLQWCAKFESETGWGGPHRPDPAEMWPQVLKRKHALDHGNAVMPIHGSELKMCTHDLEVHLGQCRLM